MPDVYNNVEFDELVALVHDLETITTNYNLVLQVMREKNLKTTSLKWSNAHKEGLVRLVASAKDGPSRIEADVVSKRMGIPTQAEKAKIKSEKNRIRQRRKKEAEKVAAEKTTGNRKGAR